MPGGGLDINFRADGPGRRAGPENQRADHVVSAAPIGEVRRGGGLAGRIARIQLQLLAPRNVVGQIEPAKLVRPVDIGQPTVGVPQRERVVHDHRPPDDGVFPRNTALAQQNRRLKTEEVEGAAAGDGVRNHQHAGGTGRLQHPVVLNHPRIGRTGDGQGAVVNGLNGVGAVRGRQHRGAAPVLNHRAGARDDGANRQQAGVIKIQRAVVGDVIRRQEAVRAIVTDFQERVGGRRTPEGGDGHIGVGVFVGGFQIQRAGAVARHEQALAVDGAAAREDILVIRRRIDRHGIGVDVIGDGDGAAADVIPQTIEGHIIAGGKVKLAHPAIGRPIGGHGVPGGVIHRRIPSEIVRDEHRDTGHGTGDDIQTVQAVADHHGEMVAVVRQRGGGRGVILIGRARDGRPVFAPLKSRGPALHRHAHRDGHAHRHHLRGRVGAGKDGDRGLRVLIDIRGRTAGAKGQRQGVVREGQIGAADGGEKVAGEVLINFHKPTHVRGAAVRRGIKLDAHPVRGGRVRGWIGVQGSVDEQFTGIRGRAHAAESPELGADHVAITAAINVDGRPGIRQLRAIRDDDAVKHHRVPREQLRAIEGHARIRHGPAAGGHQGGREIKRDNAGPRADRQDRHRTGDDVGRDKQVGDHDAELGAIVGSRGGGGGVGQVRGPNNGHAIGKPLLRGHHRKAPGDGARKRHLAAHHGRRGRRTGRGDGNERLVLIKRLDFIARAKRQRHGVVGEGETRARLGPRKRAGQPLIHVHRIIHVRRGAGLGAGEDDLTPVGGEARGVPQIAQAGGVDPHLTVVAGGRAIAHQHPQRGPGHAPGAGPGQVHRAPRAVPRRGIVVDNDAVEHDVIAGDEVRAGNGHRPVGRIIRTDAGGQYGVVKGEHIGGHGHGRWDEGEGCACQ